MGNVGHSRGSRDVLSSSLSAYLTDEYRDLLEEVHQVLENGFPCDLQSLDNYKKPLFKLVSKAFKQKWTYFCVRDLVARNKTSFTCSLLGQKDVREYPESAAAGPCLPDNTIVLVGVIRSHPDSSSRKTPHGGLYFCDNTGEIPCVLSTSIAHCVVGDIVILTRFNYIVMSGPVTQSLPESFRQPGNHHCPYLEIETFLLCTAEREKPSLMVPSGDSLTVKRFGDIPRAEIREAGKSKHQFSIQGRVTAVSPVIKSSEDVFFVQLTDMEEAVVCEVVVQVPTLFHLTHTLKLWECYTFTALTIRMMRVENNQDPSENTDRRILYATDNTQVILLQRDSPKSPSTCKGNSPVLTTVGFIQGLVTEDFPHRNRKRIYPSQTGGQKRKKMETSTTVSEWLSKKEEDPSNLSSTSGCAPGKFPPVLRHVAAVDSDTSVNDSVEDVTEKPRNRELSGRHFLSYQGVITKCVFPEAGIYELDSTVRLCLCHTASRGVILALREGARLEVHNAHLSTIPALQMRVLTVCTLSCVRIVKFSSGNPQGKYLPFIPRRFPLYGYTQRLSGPEMVWIVHLYMEYRKRFPSSDMLSYYHSQDNVHTLQSSFEKLLQFVLPQLSEKKRQVLCEVFSGPHLCHCPLRSVWTPPYRTMFPGEVAPLVEEKVKVEGWRDGRGTVVMEGDHREHPQWKYYHFSTKHQPDPPLLLVGVVDGHSRRGSMVLADKQFSLELTVINNESAPLSRGQVVALRSFTVVTERLELASGGAPGEGNNVVTHIHTCVCARRKDISVISTSGRQAQNNLSKQDPLQSNVGELGHSSSFQPSSLMASLLSSTKLCAHKLPSSSSSNVSSSCTTYCLAVEKSSLALQPLSTGQRLLGFSFSARMVIYRDLKSLKDFLGANKTPGTQSPAPGEIFVNFHGSMVKHHPFILEGFAYILTTPSLLISGKSSLKESLHLPAIEFCEEMDIQPLELGKSPIMTSQQQLVNIHDLQPVLDWRASPYPSRAPFDPREQKHKVVSFVGTIVSRRYIPDQKKKQGSALQLDKDVVRVGAHTTSYDNFNALKISPVYATHELDLKVTDPLSPDVVTVYCRLAGRYQPSWIVPGMTVRFKNFLYEKTLNHNRVYCKYCPHSSLELDGWTESLEAGSHPYVPDLPKLSASNFSLPLSNISSLVSEFFNLKLKQSSVMLIGNFTHCQSVAFKHVCSHCNQTIVDNTCRPSCVGPVGMVKVEAKCMFTDGSGEIVMFCDGELVKTVLNLSQLDWCAFKQVAEDKGQLCYRRQSLFAVQEDKRKKDEEAHTSTQSLTTWDILVRKANGPSVHRYVKVIAQPFISSSDLLLQGEPQTRNVYLSGGQVTTLAPPKLQWRSLCIEPIDHVRDTALLLQHIQDHAEHSVPL